MSTLVREGLSKGQLFEANVEFTVQGLRKIAQELEVVALNLEAASQDAKSAESRVPSVELVPLQFRMTPAFGKKFKQAALDRDMKLNELLQFVFDKFA